MDAVDRLMASVVSWFEDQGFRVALREERGTTWVDLVGDVNPAVELRYYAQAPDATLAILAAEQRWKVEEDGKGSVPGETYVDKARERLRRISEDEL